MTHSPAQNETVVLLVEDDRDDFFLTQDVLQCVPNHKYSVVWAGSYERATFELLERSYDVALVDYRIGERTGLEFIREAGRRFTDTPMILLTGVIDPHIDREAEEAGAADFLEKGAITPELLDRSIRYAIKHARRRALHGGRAQSRNSRAHVRGRARARELRAHQRGPARGQRSSAASRLGRRAP